MFKKLFAIDFFFNFNLIKGVFGSNWVKHFVWPSQSSDFLISRKK